MRLPKKRIHWEDISSRDTVELVDTKYVVNRKAIAYWYTDEAEGHEEHRPKVFLNNMVNNPPLRRWPIRFLTSIFLRS